MNNKDQFPEPSKVDDFDVSSESHRSLFEFLALLATSPPENLYDTAAAYHQRLLSFSSSLEEEGKEAKLSLSDEVTDAVTEASINTGRGKNR